MRNNLVLLLLISLFFAACTRVPAERPSDFSLSLYWDTGSLPPKYRYEYVITIGPGSQGQLVYQLGYGGPEAEDAQHWAISTGTCLMPKKLDYITLVDNTRWQVAQGALIIRDGYPELLTPDCPDY